MAKVPVARRLRVFHGRAHLHAIEPMKGVTLDNLRAESLPPKDMPKTAHDRCRARARRAGDGDDGMLYRHVLLPPVLALKKRALFKEGRCVGPVLPTIEGLVITLDLIDLLGGSQNHWNPLMNIVWRD